MIGKCKTYVESMNSSPSSRLLLVVLLVAIATETAAAAELTLSSQVTQANGLAADFFGAGQVAIISIRLDQSVQDQVTSPSTGRYPDAAQSLIIEFPDLGYTLDFANGLVSVFNDTANPDDQVSIISSVNNNGSTLGGEPVTEIEFGFSSPVTGLSDDSLPTVLPNTLINVSLLIYTASGSTALFFRADAEEDCPDNVDSGSEPGMPADANCNDAGEELAPVEFSFSSEVFLAKDGAAAEFFTLGQPVTVFVRLNNSVLDQEADPTIGRYPDATLSLLVEFHEQGYSLDFTQGLVSVFNDTAKGDDQVSIVGRVNNNASTFDGELITEIEFGFSLPIWSLPDDSLPTSLPDQLNGSSLSIYTASGHTWVSFHSFGQEACRDLFDNDNDGLVDFPADPDCTDAIDDDESAPIDETIQEAQDLFRFDRMWPPMLQPWSFTVLSGIATDSRGNVFVSDTNNRRVVKLSPNGQIISAVRVEQPGALTVDSEDFVYVTERSGPSTETGRQRRILKFTPALEPVGTFTSVSIEGFPPTEVGLAVDGSGNVYRVDELNHRIEKYSPRGQLLATFGQFGRGTGEFNNPREIEIDQESGRIFVSDADNNRIQILTLDGDYVDNWGFPFVTARHHALTLIQGDGLYICRADDLGTSTVTKYDFSGQRISQWRVDTDHVQRDGYCRAMGNDSSDQHFLYLTTVDGIYRFSTLGEWQTSWGIQSALRGGMIQSPRGIGVARSGDVYVSDNGPPNVTRFDSSGNVKSVWEAGLLQLHIKNDTVWLIGVDSSISRYSLDGQHLETGADVADAGRIRDFDIDDQGNIFVVLFKEIGNSGIAQYDMQEGIIASNFDNDINHDIAVGPAGNIYTTTLRGFLVYDQEFNQIGDYSNLGIGDGTFFQTSAIAVDEEGLIYVGDRRRNDVQVFTPEREFLTRFGQFGFGPGDMVIPQSIAFDDDGNVYVGDEGNNRIQVFKPISSAHRHKAIVLAVGDATMGREYWDTTRLTARLAYNTLGQRGFSRESIYYLSSELDIEQRIDALPTKANLEYAIREWAADADDLVIYLLGPGSGETLRLHNTDVLTADEIATWIDELQTTLSGRLTLIYDASQSGTFLPALQAPLEIARTVITSTAATENALFVANGAVSFSNFFWTQVFNGQSLEGAFTHAKEALSALHDQLPLIDSNGDGVSDVLDLSAARNQFIGTGPTRDGAGPTIFSVETPVVINESNSGTISVDDVIDADGVARVWAVVRPPNLRLDTSGSPILTLPSFTLPRQYTGAYSVIWDGFVSAGSHQLAIFAMDAIGNISRPVLATVAVENPPTKRAIILLAGDIADPSHAAAANNADEAYEALLLQGYDENSIYYMSGLDGRGVDDIPTLGNLESAIASLKTGDTQDLVLYIVGGGNPDSVQLNLSEALSPGQLATWLDGLVYTVAGNVTVVLDSDHSGGFLPALSHSKRIVISSAAAAQPALSLFDGGVSFSRYYWQEISNGATVEQAFEVAAKAIRFAPESQQAQLDDNGDHLANSADDGGLARQQSHGVGSVSTGERPRIAAVSSTHIVQLGEDTAITVEGVSSTHGIARVMAVIRSPNALTTTHHLLEEGADYNIEGLVFSVPGNYDLAIYVQDNTGRFSLPKSMQIEVLEPGFELDLSLSHDIYRAGENLVLSVEGLIGSVRDYDGLVDIYFSVTLPDGSTFYISDLALNISSSPVAIASAWDPSSFPLTELLSFVLPTGLPVGEYSWKLTLTETGRAINNADAWLAQGRAVHAVSE